jgi:glycosyltransferase involved in cell wall biosynthesis
MNEILIYDNGSCKRVIYFLRKLLKKKKIHFLFMSEKNMGKIGAWNMLFPAARGEFVVYADSDVYFYPSWDVEHLKVFQ